MAAILDSEILKYLSTWQPYWVQRICERYSHGNHIGSKEIETLEQVAAILDTEQLRDMSPGGHIETTCVIVCYHRLDYEEQRGVLAGMLLMWH